MNPNTKLMIIIIVWLSPFLKMMFPIAAWELVEFSFIALKVLPSAICWT